jgi:1-acyl-sn-glycerol-3-phosphate acyltransferase
VTPPLGPAVPSRGNRLSRALGRAALALLGWRFEGEVPNVSRVILVVAPHTSNWDFLVGISAMLALGLDARWIGKDTLFRPPLGPLLRWLGGAPVDRDAPEGVVENAVRQLGAADRLCLTLSPEGTRRRVERWKTGFHRMARRADVPVWPVALDYSRKAVVLLPLYTVSHDVEGDVRALRSLFTPAMARYPDQL